jgi:hypothetical protein
MKRFDVTFTVSVLLTINDEDALDRVQTEEWRNSLYDLDEKGPWRCWRAALGYRGGGYRISTDGLTCRMRPLRRSPRLSLRATRAHEKRGGKHYAGHDQGQYPNAVQDISDGDAITFKVRNARLLAAFFLDFLEGDPDSFYLRKVRLCRFDEGREEWRPIKTDHGKVVEDFVESPTTSYRRWLALIRRGDEQGFLSSKPESVSCETGG